MQLAFFSSKRKYAQTDPALFAGLDPEAIPRHIAIIMDGNGRWAQNRGLPRSMGHRAGVKAIRGVLRAAHDMGVEVLSVYAFSTENWKRPRDEVSTLMSLLIEYLTRELEEMDSFGVRLNVMGDYPSMPQAVVRAIENGLEKTKDNTGIVFNIALNYGGTAELVRAAQLLAQRALSGDLRPEQIDAQALHDCLYTRDFPDPELMIRTSGEQRLSNLMPMQLAYSELYFTPVYWPDFTAKELAEAVATYQKRNRRFGGL